VLTGEEHLLSPAGGIGKWRYFRLGAVWPAGPGRPFPCPRRFFFPGSALFLRPTFPFSFPFPKFSCIQRHFISLSVPVLAPHSCHVCPALSTTAFPAKTQSKSVARVIQQNKVCSDVLGLVFHSAAGDRVALEVSLGRTTSCPAAGPIRLLSALRVVASVANCDLTEAIISTVAHSNPIPSARGWPDHPTHSEALLLTIFHWLLDYLTYEGHWEITLRSALLRGQGLYIQLFDKSPRISLLA
jgi:hypothetical protein